MQIVFTENRKNVWNNIEDHRRFYLITERKIQICIFKSHLVNNQQTQSLSSPETLDSAHIEMSSKAGQNIPLFVAIHLQELLSWSSCPWHYLKGPGPAWMSWCSLSCMQYIFLDTWDCSPDTVSEEVKPFFFRTSAKVPGINQSTRNLRISFAQLFPITVRDESTTVCPGSLLPQVDKLGTN